VTPLITCVGTAVLDHVYHVDVLPDREGKHFATDHRDVGGGPAASAAVAISRLGGRSRFVGGLGIDAAAEAILSDLAAERVDTRWVGRSRDLPSPTSAVLIDSSGERMIINHTNQETMAGLEPLVVEATVGATAVLTDLRWASGCVTALRSAAASGIPSVVDYDLSDVSSNAALELADYLIFSAPALASLTGTDDPAAGLQEVRMESPAWLAATAGASGTIYLAEHTPGEVLAFDVDPVDTLGAGDVFHGAFVLGIARGLEPERALIAASAAAAIKCTRPGGRSGAPNQDELTSFLEENGYGTDTW
jgi:sulfofructose kinase